MHSYENIIFRPLHIFYSLTPELYAVHWQSVMDLLVLVGCDRGEDSLWEAERLYSFPSRNRFGWRKLAAEVFPDHVDAGLIFVHRVQDDLEIKKVISSATPPQPQEHISAAVWIKCLWHNEAVNIKAAWSNMRTCCITVCTHVDEIWIRPTQGWVSHIDVLASEHWGCSFPSGP